MLMMIGVALFRSLVLGRRNGAPAPAQERLKAGLLLFNVVLGVVVLLLSGFSAALSSGGPPA